jgi:8-oxo-dGTP pyrophosphatase MutT (NUDIX family)
MIYATAPENFSPKFEVAGCFVEHDGKILLMHRHPNKPQGGTWGVPAGKLNNGEEASDALIREVKEETGVELAPEGLMRVQKTFVIYPTYQFVYHVFKIRLDTPPEINLKLDEHTEHKWVTPAVALMMELIPDEDYCIKLAYGIE